jgi:Condensation domain
VPEERSGRVTFGQQWVIRFLSRRPAESWAEAGAHMTEVIPVPAAVTHEQISDAWSETVRIHESLRTVFRTDPSPPIQIVHYAAPVTLADVELPEPTEDAAAAAAAEWSTEPIDITREFPWRAFVGCHDGHPRYLVLVVHHVAADHGGLEILRLDVERVLRTGAPDPPARQPLDIALEQGKDHATCAAAEQWWARAWRDVEGSDLGVAEDATRFGAVMVSESALEAGRRLAGRLGVSLPSVLLAVAGVVLLRLRQRTRLTFGLLTSNRFDPRWERSMSSMTAWVPVTVEAPGGRTIADVVRNAHLAGLEAYLHGSYDPDDLHSALTGGFGFQHGPMSFDCQFNFVGEIDYCVSDDSPVVNSVRWVRARRQVGYRFLLFLATTRRGLLFNLGASERYLDPEMVRLFPVAMEAALVAAADDESVAASTLDLSPLREIPPAVRP